MKKKGQETWYEIAAATNVKRKINEICNRSGSLFLCRSGLSFLSSVFMCFRLYLKTQDEDRMRWLLLLKMIIRLLCLLVVYVPFLPKLFLLFLSLCLLSLSVLLIPIFMRVCRIEEAHIEKKDTHSIYLQFCLFFNATCVPSIPLSFGDPISLSWYFFHLRKEHTIRHMQKKMLSPLTSNLHTLSFP